MTHGNIVVFEDHHVDQARPITLTRPAFAVTGAAGYRLDEIVQEHFGLPARYIVREYLASFVEKKYTSAPLLPDVPTLFLNASLWPSIQYVASLQELLEKGENMMMTSDQRIAVAVVAPETKIPELDTNEVTSWLLGLGLPLKDSDFATIDYPFHIVPMLYETFLENLSARVAQGNYREVQDGVFLGKDVSIGEYVVFHAEEGPIVLDDHVKISDFNYLQGPLYVAPHSRITEQSSIKEYTSIGRTCKIGGEVEASIIESYTNKQHHGFLGHSYVGSWVNLGAGTSNSDLKNSYGKIRVEMNDRRVDTGLQFFGCVIGDYSKSAINTSIFTGKIIGVNSLLYGYIGQNVASFTNYAKSFGQITECSIDAAIAMQRRMFRRRDIEQTEVDIAILRTAFDLTREERTISSSLPVL
jgi:glucose-1-phosphate thymidylyltransferase